MFEEVELEVADESSGFDSILCDNDRLAVPSLLLLLLLLDEEEELIFEDDQGFAIIQ